MKNEEKKGDSSHPHRLKLIHSCQIKMYKSITWNLNTNPMGDQVKSSPIQASEKTPLRQWK
jgi:hypothetical protein